MDKKRLEILGIPIDMVSMEQALDMFKELMEKEGCSMIVTPNSEMVVAAGKNQELNKAIKAADLIIPDGIGLVYASHLLGMPLKERVTGFDFLVEALKQLETRKESVYLLGGKPGDGAMPGIAEFAAARMKRKHPNLMVAGTHHGYLGPEEEEVIVKDINESGAALLCVAMGAPKQELFIMKHKDILKCKVAIGVGGSLDVWAGNVKRAPEFWQNNGIEWLYRLIKEPSRYKRMRALPIFMIRTIIDSLKKGR